MTLVDSDARTRIAAVSRETLFVEAGAGTGKTTALVGRIVNLVRADLIPGGICGLAAITFTENAAAELRNKVRRSLEALAQADSDDPSATLEQDRCKAALQSLDDASLSTLHGFALRLLTDYPLEAGLPVGFVVNDDVKAGFERDAWWERSVDVALDDPALSEVWKVCLALGLAPGSLRKIADRLHADWDQLEGIPTAVPPIPTWDMAAIITPLRDASVRYGDVGPLGDKLTTYLQGPLRALLADLDAEEDDLGRATVLNGTPVVTHLGAAPAWNKVGVPKAGPIGLLVRARQEWEHQVADVRTACLERLVLWLRDVCLADATRRQREGALHFQDLLVLACTLLRQPQVRTALHQRWPVVMVDEFQDTDPLQVDLVHLLAATNTATSWRATVVNPGQLFFVGDPKQSIYRFRRADVALYTAVRDTIPDAQRPQLVQNFRSRPGILAVVNHSLRQLMDQSAGQVPYVDLQAQRAPAVGDPGADVLLLGGPHVTDIAGVRVVEAAHVASACRQAAAHWHVDKGRAAKYSDIAILVPTRTSLSELERALQRADVPYRIESRSLIWDTDIVRELLAMIEAIADPGDGVAVVTALRSAAFGCTDNDLLAWSRAGGTWDYRAQAAADSPVATAMGQLSALHDRRWWVPANQIIDDLIRDRRMVELTMGLPRPRDHWRRLRFVADQCRAFLDAGGSGLSEFARWARQQAERGADAIETVVNEPDDDAVRILTIHAAKGMEFPITILSGLNVDETLRVNTLWDGGRVEVRLKGFETAGWAAAREKEKELFEAELVRLLYVAATRAMDHLVVSLHHKQGSGAGHNHAARIHAQLDALVNVGARHQLEPIPLPVSQQESRETADPDLDKRSAAETERAALLARVRRTVPVSASGLAGDDQEPDDELSRTVDTAEQADEPLVQRPVSTSGATLGSAVHRVLELVDFEAHDDDVLTLATAVVTELEAPHLLAEVARRVRVALDSELLRSATGRIWKEVPVSAPVGERFVEGYIDLVLEVDGGLLVVDYKTDAVNTTEQLDEKVSHYGPQLRAYAAALGAATGLPIAGAALLFIGASTSAQRDVLL